VVLELPTVAAHQQVLVVPAVAVLVQLVLELQTKVALVTKEFILHQKVTTAEQAKMMVQEGAVAEAVRLPMVTLVLLTVTVAQEMLQVLQDLQLLAVAVVEADR
jgi:hypothetical protein